MAEGDAGASAAGEGRALHALHDLVLLDLDGVVYVGADAVPGAVEALAGVRAAGTATGFVTNNASRPPAEVADHLRRLGVRAEDEDVTTAAQAGAQLVLEQRGPRARVLAVGGPGVRAALLEVGLRPVGSAEAAEAVPDAVLQGFGPELTWHDLADATAAVRAGALWVATNTDLTLPTERGPAPGNGSLVAAVRNAVDVDPLVAGKPEPVLLRAAARRAHARDALFVGDRLDTDIAGAHRAGTASLLVLTGLSSPTDALTAPPEQRPDHLSADLSGLLSPPVAATRHGGAWRCRAASAQREGRRLRAQVPAPEQSREQRGKHGEGLSGVSTDDLVDVLRAACAAVADAPDGRDQLDVAPSLAASLEELDRRTHHR